MSHRIYFGNTIFEKLQIVFKRDILNDDVHGLIHGQLFSLVRDPIKFECNVQSSSNHQCEEVLKRFKKSIHDQYFRTRLIVNKYSHYDNCTSM